MVLMKIGRVSLVLCIVFLMVSFFGCAAPNRLMIHPTTGRTVDCSQVGWGYIGAPTALIAAEQCADRYEELGYMRLDEYKKKHKDGGLLATQHKDLGSLVASLKERGYDHLLENQNVGMKYLIDLNSVYEHEGLLRFKLAEIPEANINSVRYVNYVVEANQPKWRLCGVYEVTDDPCKDLPTDSTVNIYREMILSGQVKESKVSRPSEFHAVKNTVTKLRKEGYSILHYASGNDTYLMLKTDSVKNEGGYVKLVLGQFSASALEHKDYLYIVDTANKKYAAYPAGSIESGMPNNTYSDDSVLALFLREI